MAEATGVTWQLKRDTLRDHVPCLLLLNDLFHGGAELVEILVGNQQAQKIHDPLHILLLMILMGGCHKRVMGTGVATHSQVRDSAFVISLVP